MPTSDEIAHAIANDELWLDYQPKVDAASGIVTGVEALVRWRHPTRGRLGPDSFIPLAEQSGQIGDLTRWVIRSAVDQSRRWRDAGLEIMIAVNFSARNLEEIDCPDVLERLCHSFDVPCSQFVIEITETAAAGDEIKMMDITTRLRLKGFRISIDDFGTGYSSLVQLQRLPFSEMKIDKSFVLQCTTSRESQVIVKAIIDLAHNLNLKVVAEGVETSDVLQRLRRLGCDLIQGYFISRPMEGAHLPAWVSAWHSSQRNGIGMVGAGRRATPA
jgi:EAL domain-containing protein (putative c-di-GMP-specific phosphodiesterase class I)